MRRSVASESRRRRNRPRTRTETDLDRRQLLDKTNQEVDDLYATFGGNVSRTGASAIGCIYARYSTRHQDSIVDQVRSQLEVAARYNIHVPRENICFDLAVRGCKNQRAGLQSLKDLMANREASVLLLFATNRLYRKNYRCLEFIDQVHRELGVRVIIAKSGIDTADPKRWEMLLSVHSLIDQFVVTMYADHVRAGHQGLFAKKLVFGTITYGYGGDPIEGATTRRGRVQRRLVIDEEEAEVVRRIYDWYASDPGRHVSEFLSINEIVRRLNAMPDVPIPPRSSSGRWTRLAVRGILQNSRYRGLWKYGVTEAVFMPSKDYSRQVPRPEPLTEAQIEELRIVSDPQWFAVQNRLDLERDRHRENVRDASRADRPLLLNGFFWCSEHECALHVGGPDGRSLRCPVCATISAEERPLFTLLNRKLALRKTCEVLATLIQNDRELITEIMEACRRYVERRQLPDEQRLRTIRQRDENLTRAIDFNMRQAALPDVDEAELEHLLRELRQERSVVRRELDELTLSSSKPIRIPDEAEMTKLVDSLAEHLLDSAQGNLAQQGLVREIIRMLTGGRIELSQQGESRHKAGWLRGRFNLQLVESLGMHFTGLTLDNGESPQVVEIDYLEETSMQRNDEQVWEWLQQNVPYKEIGRRLGVGRSHVTRLAKHCYASRGMRPPDGRSLRKLRNCDPDAKYVQIAADAWRLWSAGGSFRSVARSLKTTDTTVKKAIEYWARANDLPRPDLVSRRKEAAQQAVDLLASGLLLKDISVRLGMSISTARKLIREWHSSRGSSPPDLRSRS